MKIILFVLLIIPIISLAQPCDRVWLNGKVTDTLEKQVFYNLMVVNCTSGRGVFGQPDGSFGVYVKANDSIALSIKGYHMIGFRIKPDSLCQYRANFIADVRARELDEVIIKPLKTVQQIKEERSALALRETRTITGLEAFQSPITALYERFSRKEQSKQKVAEMQYKDSQERIVQELLRLYVAYDVIKLSDEEFLDFISFLSIDPDFLRTASDIELITFIKDKLEHYNRIHKKL